MAKTKKKTSRAVYWQEHTVQWSKSGLTQAEYCRRNKISVAAFNWWKQQFQKKSKTKKDSSTSMQFVEVHDVPTSYAAHDETYEIVLSRDRTIRVGHDFDSDVLKRLITMLESRC